MSKTDMLQQNRKERNHIYINIELNYSHRKTRIIEREEDC